MRDPMNNITADAISMPVQRQLEAYNRRDIDSFMQWWANDCEYYAYPSTLLARGKQEIRDRHTERLREPDLFGQLLSRACVGNLVVDHETVRRTFPDGTGELDVICIYEIEEGRIAKAWFKVGEPRLHSAEATR
jgi:putative hydrolase of HD superfamily